jgi:hypothetical protein
MTTPNNTGAMTALRALASVQRYSFPIVHIKDGPDFVTRGCERSDSGRWMQFCDVEAALLAVTPPEDAPAVDGGDAAIRTLAALGYTYHGGQLWKPPIGPRPTFTAAPAPAAPAPAVERAAVDLTFPEAVAWIGRYALDRIDRNRREGGAVAVVGFDERIAATASENHGIGLYTADQLRAAFKLGQSHATPPAEAREPVGDKS